MSNGARLWYDFIGSEGGEPMVLLGGGGLGRQNFDAALPYLEEHYRLMICDQRGYGQSDATGIETATPETLAEDAIALMDDAGWQAAHIHGTALGGMATLAAAIKYSNRCTSIIVNSCFAKPDVSQQLFFEALNDYSRLAGEVTRSIAALVTYARVSSDFVDAHPEMVEEVILPRLRFNSFETWLAQHRIFRDVDLSEGLTTCEVPTLAIAGEWAESLDLSPSGIGLRKIAEIMPRGDLVILQGVGHLTLFERPKEHVEAIVKFTNALKAA